MAQDDYRMECEKNTSGNLMKVNRDPSRNLISGSTDKQQMSANA